MKDQQNENLVAAANSSDVVSLQMTAAEWELLRFLAVRGLIRESERYVVESDAHTADCVDQFFAVTKKFAKMVPPLARPETISRSSASLTTE